MKKQLRNIRIKEFKNIFLLTRYARQIRFNVRNYVRKTIDRHPFLSNLKSGKNLLGFAAYIIFDTIFPDVG